MPSQHLPNRYKENRLKKLMIAEKPIAAVSVVAHAQYIRPGARLGSVTVTQLRESGRGNQRLLLRGRLTQSRGGDKCRLSGAFGNSPVTIDHRRWPASQVVEHSTTVELAGKYDKASINISKVMVRDVRIVQTVAQ
jgi:uncharacterized protein YdeI (BOF family)